MSSKGFMKNVKGRNKVESSGFSSEQIKDLKSYFKELLSPVLEQIKNLNETVSNVSNILIKNDKITVAKSSEYVSTSVACDIGIIGSDIHKISRNNDFIKQQLLEHKKKMDEISNQTSKMEKLINALLKVENSWKLKRLELCEKINTVEQLLVCSLAYRDSLQTQENTVPQTVDATMTVPCQVSVAVGFDSKMELITLNNENDYPDGTWLGNEHEPSFRVRCPISKENMLYLNTRCDTPEKMALALLDYLFSRDVLATSNISGRGKHGKKRLDPLMIYGVKCHLVHHFNINDSQWFRIKQNIDSKCRTAWKKRKLAEDDSQASTDSDLLDVKFAIDKTISTTSSSVKLEEDQMEQMNENTDVGLVEGQIGRIHKVLHTSQHRYRYHDVQVMNTEHFIPVVRPDPEDCESSANNFIKNDGKGITIITTDDENFKTSPMLHILTEDDYLSEDE